MRTILITGASSDIGLAISKKFINDSNNLILCYYENKDVLTNLKKEYPNSNIDIYKLDLTDEDNIKTIVNDVTLKYNNIDILINNAAFTLDCDILDKNKVNFMKTLEINVVGTFLISKYIGNIMYDNKAGKIINIASTNGIDTGYPESIDYDASKASIINLTYNLARAYSPYVNVNCVCPGWVDTKINKDLDVNFKNKELDKILLNRFARPDEIANVVCFLASDEASYINSTIIRVDGGRM